MKVRSTILAVFLAAASVAAAWLAWRQDRQPLGSVDSVSRALFARGEIPVDAVERITLTRGDAAPMVFERRNGEWMQTQPVEFPVDVFSMRQLAIATMDLEAMGEPVAAADRAALESMSLAPPLATLLLEWDGGSKLIHLGRKGVGGLAYLRIEGEQTVHLVRQALHDRAVEQSPFEWRRKRLFDYAGVESTQAEFEESGALGYVLERQRRKWAMTSPLHARLDVQAVEEHLALIGAAQALSFIADAPADLVPYSLDSPRATLSVATPVQRVIDGQPQEDLITERLLIGGSQTMDETAGYFAMVDGRDVIFTLPRAVIERLAASGHLIDLRALDVDPADVRSIRITAAEEFTLIRDREDPTQWVSLDAAGARVRNDRVAELFETLTVARAVDVTDGQFPFDRLLGHIMFFDYNGEALGAVQIARLDDGRWILFSDDHMLRIFPASIEIPQTLDAYLETPR